MSLTVAASGAKWISQKAISAGFGLEPRVGNALPQAKLTPDQIAVIRARVARGETQRLIAREYGVAPSAISKIVNRKLWAWL